MDRRTFGKLAGFGAIGALAGEANVAAGQPRTDAGSSSSQLTSLEGYAAIPPRQVAFPSRTFRRLLIDTHVPDWDSLLTEFNSAEYVATIAAAGFQSLEQYATSHVGLCLWRTKVGQMHRGMKGRDYFGEVMDECRRHGLHRVAYYSLIFDDWAYESHPDWRILPEEGYDPELFCRTGTVCPNSPYRDHAFACLRELVGGYDFECIFLDQPFWPTVCYCPHCTERFWREHNTEPPRIVNWKDPAWRAFQKSRQQWMRDFLMTTTQTIKQIRPVTVYYNAASMFSTWQMGTSLEQNDAADFCGGDFYGGYTQSSVVCKAYSGLTRTRPFEFMTSRASPSLVDFENTKPFQELLLQSAIPLMHAGSYMLIDAIHPMGTLNHQIYEYMSHVNAAHDGYEEFLGGELQADFAIYYDKNSMYDPDVNGMPAAALSPNIASSHSGPKNLGLPEIASPKMTYPHLDAVVGAARILRQAHLPFGVVTNVNLDQLSQYRAVILPSVIEMTSDQANHFREFVREGGTLYASGPSSLSVPEEGETRFLLEDVFGVRYTGRLGESVTYLSPRDPKIAQVLWPQQNLTFPGSMVRGEGTADAEVLATVTLPLVAPDVGYSIGSHFSQIWSNPPAATPGMDPGIVVNTFGKGKAVWIAAPIESMEEEVSIRLVTDLLRSILPAPYKFEAETHPAVEMTLLHQEDKHRLLAGLINLQEQLPLIPVGATVRVSLPTGRTAKKVLQLPEQREIAFTRSGPYVEFQVAPFTTTFMAVLEYD